MTKTAAAPSAPYETLFIGDVLIADIAVISNTRKYFDPKRLEELAQSVRDHGVQQPITLRPTTAAEGAKYELIAGERRLRASIIAEKTTIFAKVLKVNDAQAEDLRALENLHREDLRPVEEAQAFKNLMEKTGRTAADLASTLGKSEAYVHRAVRLLDLPQAILDSIEAGTITPAHGHQLLRLPEDKREEWLGQVVDEYSGGVIPAKNLGERIDSELGQDLKKAPWPKDEPFGFEALAVRPVCSTCPHNSGNQGMLFDGAQAGRCLNKPCYDGKMEAWGALIEHRTKTKAEKEGVEYVGAAKPKWDYKVNGEAIKGHLLAPADKLPAKGKRSGYGLAVSLAGIPVPVWVKLTDEKARAEAAKKAPAGYDYERDNFIHAAIREALLKAKAELAAKTRASRKIYQAVAEGQLRDDAQVAEVYASALGRKKFKVGELTDNELAGLLLLCSTDIKVPNEKAITAATRKTAGKQYTEEKKAAAAAKTSDRAPQPAEDGNDDGAEDDQA